MLPGFRGKCGFRQYIPSKPSKYGIKIFATVNSKVFYTGNIEIYAGKQPKDPYLISNKPADVIKRLAEPIYSSGHNSTADNWFIDRNLISKLEKKWLSYVGTVHKNKPQLPPEFVSSLCLKTDPQNTIYLVMVQIAYLYLMYPKGKKPNFSFKYAFQWHCKFRFTKAWYNRILQPNEVRSWHCGRNDTCNVARNTRRWPVVIFYTILNIAGINARTVHMLDSNVKIRHRIFIRNLTAQLASE